MANIVYTYKIISSGKTPIFLSTSNAQNVFMQIDTSTLLTCHVQILYWLLHHTEQTILTTKTNNICISIDKDPAVYNADKPDWIKANICLIDFFSYISKNLHYPEKSLKFGYSKLICKNMSWEGDSTNKKQLGLLLTNHANDLNNISQLFLCLLV